MARTHETLVGLFSDIATEIRNKDGTTDAIVADDFPARIASISAINVGYQVSYSLKSDDTQAVWVTKLPGGIIESATFTEAGVYTPESGIAGWNNVTVSVSAISIGYSVSYALSTDDTQTIYIDTLPGGVLESATFSEAGTFTPESGIAGWNKVVIENMASVGYCLSYSLNDDSTQDVWIKSLPSGTIETIKFTENSIYTPAEGIMGWNSVEVAVPPYSVEHTDTYTLDTVGDAIDMGSYHTYRYISTSGLYKPADTLTITDVGSNFDVASYAFVSTSGLYKPANTLTVTSTGIYDVKGYASVSVDMTGAGYVVPPSAYNCVSNMASYSGPNVIAVGQCAFQQCSILASVSIPNVRFIDSTGFGYCYKLKSINMTSVTNIGNYAFDLCSSLAGALDLPYCNYIGIQAFRSCSQITTLSICSSMSSAPVTIGSYAFSNCTGLTTVSIRSAVGYSSSPLVLGGYAFYSCSKLTSFYFSGPINVGPYAFDNTSLSVIPGPSRYSTTPMVGMGVVSVGVGAFTMCFNLRYGTVYAPTINSKAFAYCTNLSYIILSSCALICDSAFYSCSSFATLYLYSYFTALSTSSAFLGTLMRSTDAGSIYVNTTLLDYYKSATNWSYYSGHIFGIAM